MGKLNLNSYHKDHFEYNYELNDFKCQENQYLYFFAKYSEPHKYPEKSNKIKRRYNNYSLKTAKQETKSVHPHKHIKPLQNTVQKCKKQ